MESFAPLPRDVHYLKKPFDFELLLRMIRELACGSLHSVFANRKGGPKVDPTDPTDPSGAPLSLRKWFHRNLR
jgi:hypothetical protein